VLTLLVLLLVLLFGWCRGADGAREREGEAGKAGCSRKNQAMIKAFRVACVDDHLLLCSMFDPGEPWGVWEGLSAVSALTECPKARKDARYGSECGQSLGGCFDLQKFGRSKTSEC
jgi:hypothetical protein